MRETPSLFETMGPVVPRRTERTIQICPLHTTSLGEVWEYTVENRQNGTRRVLIKEAKNDLRHLRLTRQLRVLPINHSGVELQRRW